VEESAGLVGATAISWGKEILIKSVAQAIPTFSMSCFKLPRGLYEHINSLLRKFWWGSKEGQRKTCLVSWEQMTQPKSVGGLGFRDIELFNLLLLSKTSMAARASTRVPECKGTTGGLLSIRRHPIGRNR
jgi:hypothetical protein